MSDALLAPTFLFRFSTPCIHRKSLWTKRGLQLGEDFRLPSFGQLEGRPVFGDLRAAWNEGGLVFALEPYRLLENTPLSATASTGGATITVSACATKERL